MAYFKRPSSLRLKKGARCVQKPPKYEILASHRLQVRVSQTNCFSSVLLTGGCLYEILKTLGCVGSTERNPAAPKCPDE